MNSKIVCIVGPTGSGKSDIAMDMASKYNGEIICADSRTVYQGMDIGTAKPTADDRRLVIHHLLDEVSPDESFNASQFQRLATQAIGDIAGRGKLPMLVGGTGLYVDSVVYGFDFSNKPDPQQRRQLQAMSVEQLQQIISDRGLPVPANDRNPRHLMRTIETD